MSSCAALLAAYLVGGVTFIPILVIALLAHGYHTFPLRDDVASTSASDSADDIVQPGDDVALLDEARKAAAAQEPRPRPKQDLDFTAGYFAVCREYTPMGINAKPIERSTPVGSTTVAPPSPSVYQTMYRSIFDRKPAAGPLDSNSMSQRPKKAGNVFYVVLRHGHLMLFDDDEQLEVRHVISLAHHDISIYSGGDTTPEGELFIKRNALCLARKRHKPDETPDGQVSKPFFLFSENCSAKEDFYFALLRNQEQAFGFDSVAPTPKQFDVKNIISLVQKLHSSEDHIHSRWLNAMLGRIFLAVHRTPDLENFIRDKITKKISRVKRPSFLTNISIQKIDTGEAAPYFANLRLRDLTVEGECVVESDVKYSGNFRIEVGATARIDLGTRFKTREVNLVLAVVLRRVEGHVLFKVKAPPSNRVWLSFQTMPKMEMAIEPIVSSRQITYTVILRQIENRIKEVFAETLVQPFWDDVPFFKTEHKAWRGGIFEGDDAVEPSAAPEAAPEPPAEAAPASDRPEDAGEPANEPPPLEKSHSLPLISPSPDKSGGLFGKRVGKNANDGSTPVPSTGVEAKASTAASSLRSPNIIKNSTDPIVGTETAHADIFKPSSSPPDHATSYMAALHSRSQDASPAAGATIASPPKASPLAQVLAQSPAPSADGGDGEREAEAEAEAIPVPLAPGRRNTASSAGSSSHGDASVANSPTPSTSSSFKAQAGSKGLNLFLRREKTANSASTESSNGGDVKRNTLAAVTNAAAQARQWGWNALQRRQDAKRQGEKPAQIDLSQPMGRGQPLPPPGMPLPGPTNSRATIGTTPAPRRKQVPEQQPLAAEPATQGERDGAPGPAAPAPPPPRPRRRQGSSQGGEEADVAQNMLVVAAPDESRPGTPAAAEEDSAGRPPSWARDAATAKEAAGAAQAAEQQPSVVVTSPETCGGCPALEAKTPCASPIVALPAASVALDDDDYSGWIDDDLDVEPLPPDKAAAGRGE